MTHYEGISNMLTTADLARLFNVHVTTIIRWSRRGTIKAYRIGPRGDRRFRREDVASLLLERASRRYFEAE